MGKYFSDVVDKAIEDIYYCYDGQRAKAAAEVLFQAAWDVVYEKAEAGCLFCQYMIGNTYYFLDVIEIGDRSEREFGCPCLRVLSPAVWALRGEITGTTTAIAGET